MARKLTKPKVKTKTVAIPKTKIIKQRVVQPTKEKEPQNKPLIIKPIKPITSIPIADTLLTVIYSSLSGFFVMRNTRIFFSMKLVIFSNIFST